MRTQKLIAVAGIFLSLMLLNIAFADSSTSYNVDVSSLSGMGGYASSANFGVNDTLTGFVDGDDAQSGSYILQSGLVALESYCGNGLAELGEVCDEGANNSQYCPYGSQAPCGGCNNLCNGQPAITYCGDGMTDSGNGEECDDGNNQNGDGCNSLCRTEGPGGGGAPGPSGAICGNGIREGGEQCDDGNNQNGDGCSGICLLEPPAQCGDGVREQQEECDDGNLIDSDACTARCTTALCGDGSVWAGVEACDDGNQNDGDGCLNNCTLPACGDGILYYGVEQCDDGNQNDGDGCSAICELETVCGDGVKEGYEQCDDGNSVNGDGCSDICQIEPVCGNGKVEAGEDCDDGNVVPGDGCSATCREEIQRLITVIAKPEKRVPGTGNWSVPATLRFYDSASKALALTIPVNTNGNGYAEFESAQVPAGIYDISLKGQSHLTHIIRNKVIDDSATITLDFTGGGAFFLLAGDVQAGKDDYVNGLDFSAMSSVIYQSSLDADLNLDGQVNGLDFSIASVNIYKSGERI